MARFVQTTAENVEAALQLAEELVRQGYQESEIQLIVDSEAREDETSLKYEGFNVRFVETRSNSAWAEAKEKLDLTAQPIRLTMPRWMLTRKICKKAGKPAFLCAMPFHRQ